MFSEAGRCPPGPCFSSPPVRLSLDCLKIAQIFCRLVVVAVPSQCFALLKEMVALLVRKMSELLFKNGVALHCRVLRYFTGLVFVDSNHDSRRNDTLGVTESVPRH